MTIYREYEWLFRGFRFSLEKEWDARWLEKLKSLRHEIRDPAQWDFFIAREPYKQELINLIAEIQDIGFEKLELDDPPVMLEYLLSFVQHLEYVHEVGEYPRYPMETIIDGGGDCDDSAILMGAVCTILRYGCGLIIWHDHADLGIAARPDEFTGKYFTKNKVRYYYCHCNAPGYRIGQYNGKYKGEPKIYHMNQLYP